MKRFITMIGACVLLTTAANADEYAWLRFDPERLGTALDPAFTNGWHAIEQYEFSAPEVGEAVAVLGFIGPIGPSSPQLMQDVIDETYFDSAELVLDVSASQSRLVLEGVMVAEQAIEWEGEAQGPRQHLSLAFRTITYIYEPDDETITGSYSEVDLATGAGSAGEYVPRDPTVPPIFGATLSRDSMQPNAFQLTWESEPGVQYDVEYADDLTDPDSWTVVPGGQVLGGDGRLTTIPVTESRGFYRVRER